MLCQKMKKYKISWLKKNPIFIASEYINTAKSQETKEGTISGRK